MTKLLVLALVTAACSPDDSALPPAGPGGPIGALLVTAEVDDTTISRLSYSVTAPDFAEPMTGELAVQDGVAHAQLSLPIGVARTVQVSYANSAGEVCKARLRDVTIEGGRTAQVIMVPACGESGLERANKPPRIEAIYASRRSVDVGELVSLAVLATDTNNDSLTYRWTENVVGFGFDQPRAALTSWKAGPRALAQNRLTITVRDGRGGTVSRTLTMDFDGVAFGPGTCAEPTEIKIGQRLRGFTRGSSAQHSDTCGIPEGAAPEHVFRLEVPTQQDVSISLAGSAFFARAYVRSGACDATPELACEFGQQRIDLAQAEPGTYFIVVDGDSVFSQGEFQISVFSGVQPEECRNFTDDDGDGALDCADSDCAFEPGCLECAFDCDPDPNDCMGGQCDSFFGRCNTFVRFGEKCDADSDPSTRDVCDDNAKCVPNTAACGNGIFEPGEQCDDGNTVDGDGCSASCEVIAVCGNGIFEFPEECEDGNVIAGDGCDPSCRVERCGPIDCNDFNSCTTEVCTDPVNGACEVTALPDGATCDNDNSPTTTETCQAGACVAPAPDTALIILDPAILADPAFSLEAMHARLAPLGVSGNTLFEQWAKSLTTAMTVNGNTAAGRPGWTTFLAGLPLDADNRLDVAAAGFLPSAMVNRFDLRTPGNCGENRLVFTKTTGVFDGGNRATIIFEFNVPDDGSNCANALAPWLALRGLGGEALRAASVALLERFANPLELNTLRTNEFVQAPFWELREFHLVGGEVVPATVVDSVPFELAQDPTFRQFVVQNAGLLNHGAREIGVIPTSFLAAASRADGSILQLGNIVPSLPGLEANLNIMTCSGCHLTHTGTGFVHIAERAADRPSVLSSFLRSELEFRAATLEQFLGPQP